MLKISMLKLSRSNEERAAEAEEWEAYAETDEAEETEEVSEDTFKEVAE